MFFTDFVMGTLSPFMIQLLLWNALFSDTGDNINGFGFQDMMYYYAFALVFSRLNNGYGIIQSFSKHVKEGQLEVYLTKPFSYMTQMLLPFLGESVLYAIPLIALFTVKLLLSYENISGLVMAFLLFFLIFVLSQLLCFFLSFAIALLSFWVIEYNILLSFSILSSALLGGTLLPPSFWPTWLIPLMKFNPYRFIISAPAEFLSTKNLAVFQQLMLGSIFYILCLLFFIHLVWKKGMKAYHGAGG
ncbi:ABC-2 family transporter protein [Bartonella sp. MM73XJBT.G]|uniref:ABC-2 family transporter protein n=1 Tax=Bartonella sp. MM73XJBT.G TaxID=3019097 RepID=UPI00235E0AA6|nr:ABC-2 family transporter protein [Bartonella sp. MM73XJBT.G]